MGNQGYAGSQPRARVRPTSFQLPHTIMFSGQFISSNTVLLPVTYFFFLPMVRYLATGTKKVAAYTNRSGKEIQYVLDKSIACIFELHFLLHTSARDVRSLLSQQRSLNAVSTQAVPPLSSVKCSLTLYKSVGRALSSLHC